MKSGLLFLSLCLVAGTAYTQTYNWDATFANNGQLTLVPGEMVNSDNESGDGLMKLADGKLLLAVSNPRTYLRRLLPNGQPDSSFANYSISTGYPVRQGKMVMLANGKILLVGIEDKWPSKQVKIFRLLPDGSPDPTFHVNGGASIDVPHPVSSGIVQDLLLQPDGKVLAYLATPKNTWSKAATQVLRIDIDGNADKSFGLNGWYLVPGGTNGIAAGIVLSRNRIVVAYQDYDRWNAYILQGLDINGQPDLTFGNKGRVIVPNTPNDQSSWICSLPDGRIVAGGGTHFSGAYFLYRFDPEGRIDSSFGYHGQASLFNLGVAYQGKCVLADKHNGIRVITAKYSPSLVLEVSRVDSTGKKDLAFGNWGKASLGMPGTFPQPGEVLLLADESMYLAGAFFNTKNRDYFIASINPEGQGNQSLGKMGILGGYLPTKRASFGVVRPGRNGTIYSRYMPSLAGDPSGYVKISPAGIIDSAFGINGLAISNHYYFDTLSDGKLISGGFVYNPNNAAAYTQISRFTTKGLPDSSFGINGSLVLTIRPGFHPWQIRTVKGDKLAICGSYPRTVQASGYGVAWFNSNGQPDTTMGNRGFTELPMVQQPLIYLLEQFADGSLLLGGFSGDTYDSKYTIFRLLPTGQPDTGFGTNGVLTDPGNNKSGPTALIPQPDGSMVIVYYQNNITTSATYLARFTADGKPHPDFQNPGPLLIRPATSVASETGHIILLTDPKDDSPSQAQIYRFQPNGAPDTAYGHQGKSILNIQPGASFHKGAVIGKQLYLLGQHSTEFVQKALLVRLTDKTAQPMVSGFSLINATTDKDLQPLPSGSTFNIADIRGRSINIRANVSDTTIKSIVMELSGKQTHRQVESIPAYALFGNTGNDYAGWTPAPGNYTLTATPYTGAKGTGTAGMPLTVSFTITDELTLSSLDLVNARTNTRIGALANGATIDLAQTPDINIVALPGKGLTQSVVFGLNNNKNHKLENSAPYALASDNKGDYSRWNVKPGTYTITATPYSETRARGKAGEAKTITITIINSAVKSAIAANSLAPVLEEGATLQAGVYPNPTSGAATLRFVVPQGSFCTIDLLDAGGAVTQRLYNGKATGGVQQIQLHMERLNAGVYFARIMTEGGSRQVVQIQKQ